MIDQLTLADVVTDSAKEVFETMIFMEVDTQPDTCPLFHGQGVFASITFKGTLQGRLTIHVSEECAELVARNMLGMDMDENLCIEDTCDAIGEVSNMVLGSIKTRIQDQYTDIEVSVPSVILGREIKNSFGENADKAVTCVYLDDEHAAEFMLIYREQK